jgi:hypothetical protein
MAPVFWDNFSSCLEIFCRVGFFLESQTSSQRGISGKNPVNNFLFKLEEQIDFIGRFELFAGCSRVVFGEQAVGINSLSVWEFEL